MKQEKQPKEPSKKHPPQTIKLTRQERKDLIDDVLFESLDWYSSEDAVKELSAIYADGLGKKFVPYKERTQHEIIVEHIQRREPIGEDDLIRAMESFASTRGRAIKLATSYKEYLS